MMKINYSIAALPAGPKLKTLRPGQVFNFAALSPANDRKTYMVVKPWPRLHVYIEEFYGTPHTVTYVNLESGNLLTSGTNADLIVNVLRAEVLCHE